MNQSELEANTCHRRQARENVCEQVAIGLSFTSDWWRKWREIFQPITERSKAKPKQNANYFRHSNENRSIKLFLCFVEKPPETGTGLFYLTENHPISFS